VELTKLCAFRPTGSHDRMLCMGVRVRFSGNVCLVQMFINLAIYVGPAVNNVQLL